MHRYFFFSDRILDMGFRDQLIRILDYLPQGTARQTLLFSATQTKDVKHLATLSINRKTVEYVGVHDEDSMTTPDRLKQSYVIVPAEHKLNCLYSFLKSHLKCKTIVFFATCSQVRHAWDLFCRLRPGLSVLAIHGKLSQTKRLQVYDKFTTTPHSVMFATDVASRGLDFPSVDWVVQVDAPEDYDMYVHRVGRTARCQQDGSVRDIIQVLYFTVVVLSFLCLFFFSVTYHRVLFTTSGLNVSAFSLSNVLNSLLFLFRHFCC